jgi:hypothetical protein
MLSDCATSGNLNDLEPKLQDDALLEDLILKLEEIINTKDVNGSSLIELTSGFKVKLSIEITKQESRPIIDFTNEKPRTLLRFSSALKAERYLCLKNGVQYWSLCEDCSC